MKYVFIIFALLFFIDFLPAQCGTSNWTNSISNDCGDLQPSGGLAPGSPTIFCEGQTVTVENNSSPASAVQKTYIDWGDGYCQTFNGFQAQMTHAYDFPNDTCITSNSNGTIVFPVRLGVEKSCPTNLKSFNFLQFNVVVRFKPIADFTASPAVLCVNAPVNFINKSCENSNNPTYLWDFGDGTTSTIKNPGSHTYATPGTYTVTLKITNSCGTSTFSQSITVTPPATAAATPSATTICAGQTVNFTNQSINAVSYTWTITPSVGTMFVNNTNSGSQNPEIKFNNPGTYTVKLKVNGCGNPEWMTMIEVLAPASVAIASIPDGCASGAVTITPAASVGGTSPTVTWSFPGGNPSSSNSNPPGPVTYSSQGTYVVTVMTNNFCGTATDTDTFSVAPAATAAFSPSTSNLCGPDEILTLTNNSVNGNSFSWTVSPNAGFVFTNGTNASSNNPQLKFSLEGTYTITLTVNACGNPVATQTVMVRLKPTVNLINTNNNCEQTVVLNPVSLVTFGGGAADSTGWTFLNGSIPSFSGPNPPNVTFSGVNIFAITVHVSNVCGNQTATDTFSILPPATAQATISDDTLCAPAEILKITNGSTNAFSNSSYTWTVSPNTGFSFVNGTSVNSANPEIEFSKEGLYMIKLTVNGCGNPVWDTTIFVILTPSVSMAQIPEGCVDVTLNPLTYTQFGIGTPTLVEWTFGGGIPASGSGLMPGQVSFTGYGAHFIAVTVSNICGIISAADTFQIIEPQDVIIQPIGPFCNTDAPVQLQATPVSGTWSGPGVSPSGIFNPANANLNSPSQLVYVFDIGDSTCAVQDTIEVLVQGTVIDAGLDFTVCLNGGNVTLTATPPAGVWSGNGITPGGVFDPEMAGTGTHLLTFAFTDLNTGCVNTDVLEIKVLGIPTAALDSIGRTCIDEPIDFGLYSSGADVVSCSWDFGDGNTDNICDPVHTYSIPGNYTITFIVGNAASCKDTVITEIQVVTPPNAAFVTDTTQGCADLPVAITNSSNLNNYTEYIWNFGNGQVDTIQEPGTIVYTQGEKDTTYLITLNAVNGCGNATAQQSITVFPRPQVRFGTDISSGCTPLKVSFNNVTVGNPDFFQWYINGILVSTDFQLPEQVFLTNDQDSVYYIALIAGNECGLDTVVHTILVKPNPVKAFFNTDTLIGCQPFSVRLIDYSTQGLYVSWDLGDGTTATGDTVWHTFSNSGQFVVQEFVNNGCGFDTTMVTITVLPAPLVSFTHLPIVCRGDTIVFQNTSSAIIGSYWSFGDGAVDSTQSSSPHVYNTSGVYTVSMVGLAVTTGCPATATSIVEVKDLPQPNIMLTDSSGCEPFLLQPANTTLGSNFYVWDFGDGSTITGPNGQHKYPEAGQYTVSVVVTDFWGCESNWSFTPIQVYHNPQVDFTVSQTELCTTPTTLVFTNKTIYADAYFWIYGSLGTSNQVNPSLVVSMPGTLPVSLVAENQYGCRDTLAKNITIYTRPELDFMVTDQTGCVPFFVQFENFSQGVNQYNWHFGDGEISHEPNPGHTYTTAGIYTVTLHASADSICFDSLQQSNYITALSSPVANFTFEAVSDTTVVPNGIFRFSDNSIQAIRWHWDFGDGDTSALRDPVHRYFINGPHPVTLIVFNDLGCTDTIVKFITPDFLGGLFVPNALAPESGQPGEREFKAIGLGLKEFEVSVYASNGQRVWHSNALIDGQPSEAWNGRFDNTGEILPQGIYSWKIFARFESGRIWDGMSFGGDEPVTEGKVLLIR